MADDELPRVRRYSDTEVAVTMAANERLEELLDDAVPLLEDASMLLDALLYETDESTLQWRRVQAAQHVAQITEYLEREERVVEKFDAQLDRAAKIDPPPRGASTAHDDDDGEDEEDADGRN